MVFQNPMAFWIIIPMILILWWRFSFLSKRRVRVWWSSLQIFQSIPATSRVLLRWLPFALECMAVILLVIALARPQRIDTMVKKNLDGIDIMMVLDISFSMMAEDMNPGTRLGAAKNVIQNFIDELTSDRVGLILFSGESYTRIPLTLDYHLFKEEIARIETSPDIQQGTAIGVAITNAVARLKHSKAKSRVIIMLTDGENNRGNISPETAVSIAKSFNIKIYPIGVGSKGRARIPIKQRDVLGNERVFYSFIDSEINVDLLSQIAQETKGKFFLAKDLQTLKDIFDEIGKLEKSEIEVKKWTRKQEEFQNFLRNAIALYILSLFLSLTVFGRVF